MRKMALFAAALTAVTLAPAGRAEAGTVDLTMSNFRYCAAESCSPADIGYVRGVDGPAVEVGLNAVDVHPGDTVTWTYRDTGTLGCDFFAGCSGHKVVFEDGTTAGTEKGFAAARSGPTTISVVVDAAPGAVISYFCSVNQHYALGMTGVLRVV